MARHLPRPFRVDWDDLGLEHVTAFLAEPRDESLTWEGKGGDIRPEHVREAVCGFGNSDLGGLLILGASQDRRTRAWTIDGWQPRDDVELWVGNCLANGGVTPRPSIVVKSWPVGGGVLAVVAVWPVSLPPAMTSSGQVWERTSSATVMVKDPVALRRLFDKGAAAEDRVHRLSNSAADDLFNGPPGHRALAAFAAASLSTEVSALIFRRSFAEALLQRVKALTAADVAPNLQPMVRARFEPTQAAATTWSDDGWGEATGYSIRVGRHGGVAIGYANPDVPSGADWAGYSIDQLRRAWQCATEILSDLGALGPTHVAARFSLDRGSQVASATWSDMASDGADEISAMVRDVRRAMGHGDWEPEAALPEGD